MSSHSNIIDELEKGVTGLEILQSGGELEEKSHDYWMRSRMQRRLEEGSPCARALVRPTSTEQVAAVLEIATRTGTPVVPYGLGSGVCGAVLASGDEIVIDMGAMARILEINENSLTVTVQPGMRGSDFENELNDRGFTMGHFPQSIEVSTVGGWCATRAAGQFSTLYGNIEQMILGCEAVLADGRIVRLPPVPRSATGPDLRQLLVGSEGALGIFTELTLRIHPLPEAQRGQCFTVPSIEAGVEALRLALRVGWTPAVTRLYDAVEAGRNFSGVADEGRPVLLLLSEGPASKVEAEAEALRSIVEAQGGEDKGTDPVSSWLEHRNEVPGFDELLDQGLVVDTIEVACAWEQLAGLWEAVAQRGSEVEGMIAMSGHVSHCYTQGANIYFTFVVAQSDLVRGIEIYDQVWDLTISATKEFGGTIAHHHGIGRVRKKWLRSELGSGVELLQALKKAFDPAGIMNPGVLLDFE